MVARVSQNKTIREKLNDTGTDNKKWINTLKMMSLL